MSERGKRERVIAQKDYVRQLTRVFLRMHEREGDSNREWNDRNREQNDIYEPISILRCVVFFM